MAQGGKALSVLSRPQISAYTGMVAVHMTCLFGQGMPRNETIIDLNA
jgi:hypothetical protein